MPYMQYPIPETRGFHVWSAERIREHVECDELAYVLRPLEEKQFLRSAGPI